MSSGSTSTRSGSRRSARAAPTWSTCPAERYEHLDGRLEATSDYAAMSELDAMTICVPTPLSKTRTPDISQVVSAAESVAENLAPGSARAASVDDLPGHDRGDRPADPGAQRAAGRARLLPRLRPRARGPGQRAVHDPQHPEAGRWGDARSAAGAPSCCISQIVDVVIPVSSTMVAETAKLHENTFRAVNIALANELALMCSRLGISPWEVIEAASTKPFGFLPHYPGPGLGGDCIPVVPHFLAWRLREYGYSAQLIEAAHEVNAQMPVFVVHKVADALNESGPPVKGSRILLLGMAYKPDIHDTRESPSLEVMRQLLERHAEVRYCDPWVERGRARRDPPRERGVVPERMREADCVVLLTAHRQVPATSRCGTMPR